MTTTTGTAALWWAPAELVDDYPAGLWLAGEQDDAGQLPQCGDILAAGPLDVSIEWLAEQFGCSPAALTREPDFEVGIYGRLPEGTPNYHQVDRWITCGQYTVTATSDSVTTVGKLRAATSKAISALAAVVAVVGLAACTVSPPAGSAPADSAPVTASRPASGVGAASTPLPPPAPLQPPAIAAAVTSDPDSVARTVLLNMYMIDTTRDSGFAAGLRRAARLLSPAYAASVQAAPTPAPDAQWQQWIQHQAYTQVSVTTSPEDAPPDSTTSAHRAYVLTYTALGRDGWSGQPQTTIALVTLAAGSSGWTVTRIDFS